MGSVFLYYIGLYCFIYQIFCQEELDESGLYAPCRKTSVGNISAHRLFSGTE